SPGPLAAVHDVYFGTSFDDVNAAPTMNTLDLLVSNDQPGTTYDPDGLLDFGQTYYWRIDEVNSPPDSTVFKGAVWSFTVEDFAFPITNVTATASSENTPDMAAGKTVDGSGLNGGDLHSVEPTDMWLSSVTGAQPTWIQYEFDKSYNLLEMWVWNSNQLLEPVIGFGVKDATIEISEDGANWISLGDVEIARAPGVAGNAHDATIDLSGTTAQFVRLTVNSGWGGILPQYGLGEVRFFFIPVEATDPVPADGDSGVELDVTLSWRSGREVASHEVYFSTDKSAVEDGTALVATVAEGNFQPGALEYGQIYYWKVNEVNDAAAIPVREGEVWEFSSVENLVVDDFEGYTDDDLANEAIWQIWVDGFGVPENGSQVGYLVPPYAEQSIVSGGRQSMPFMYGGAGYSEAERTFAENRDWTVGGISQLSVWFRGFAGSVGSFVEGPVGTFTMTGSGTDIWDNADEFHFAYKSLTGPGTIIARVESVENTDDWAKAGVMIRETLDPGSTHAFACVTPANGVASQSRIDTGSSSFNTAEGGITAPHWVKLERGISGAFTVSHSTNGTSWVPVSGANPTNIQMASTVYIGLAVTSHNAGVTCQGVFSNVTTTGTVSGQWASQDIGIATNAAEPLYIGVTDSAGNRATITHEDPAATQTDSWSVWSVNLSDLADQGVNLASVKKLALGVGNPAGTVAGGSGTMYFDDIAVGNPVQAAAGGYPNLLTNGGFEDGVLDPWNVYGSVEATVVQQLVGAAVPEDPAEGGSCLHLNVTDPGANFWDAGLQHTGHVFEADKRYTLSVFMKAKEETLDVNLKPELAADPWSGFGAQVVTITDQWAEYSVTTPVFAADADPAAITLHIGFAVAEFWVDDVKFYEGDYVPSN
ncbi:MAG: carbohydrate binding domain-containing protein, partial [Planctomycetota bacterium]|nr:carbohydrate binding domain-containing protein [Planctomycetota bacterium]